MIIFVIALYNVSHTFSFCYMLYHCKLFVFMFFLFPAQQLSTQQGGSCAMLQIFIIIIIIKLGHFLVKDFLHRLSDVVQLVLDIFLEMYLLVVVEI